jgi:hypothetical protein
MHGRQRIPARVKAGIVVVLALVLSAASIAFARAQDKLDATIFTYDGTDFVRSKTTLMTEDGKSAANTKLDHNSAAYRALSQKHSYTGEVTVFGRRYDASYAPLTSSDGKLTGALFVAVSK